MPTEKNCSLDDLVKTFHWKEALDYIYRTPILSPLDGDGIYRARQAYGSEAEDVMVARFVEFYSSRPEYTGCKVRSLRPEFAAKDGHGYDFTADAYIGDMEFTDEALGLTAYIDLKCAMYENNWSGSIAGRSVRRFGNPNRTPEFEAVQAAYPHLSHSPSQNFYLLCHPIERTHTVLCRAVEVYNNIERLLSKTKGDYILANRDSGIMLLLGQGEGWIRV